jgi:hypothetical protein
VPTTAPVTLSSELRVSVGRFVRRLRAERGEADLTEGQFGVLTTLLRHGDLTPVSRSRSANASSHPP